MEWLQRQRPRPRVRGRKHGNKERRPRCDHGWLRLGLQCLRARWASSCTAASGCVAGWVKYWLLQNSWGRGWGQGGYWKHRRGTDEARIESWAATAPEVDVNCNESNDYYGGSINYPRNTWKKAVPQSIEKFVNLMEQVKPKPPKSDTCPGASWDPKNRNSIGGFQIVHNIADVTRAQ